ncbi:piggyBac transposable element-derived protein 4-like [Aplochiton taeniatus]
MTLCANTNANGARRTRLGARPPWVPVTVPEMYGYVSLVLFTGLLRGPPIATYWSNRRLYKFPFPRSVMTSDRFKAITGSLHLSDPQAEEMNKGKRGGQDHDQLFALKPLMNQLRVAFRDFYQPHKDLSIHERVAATKDRTGREHDRQKVPSKGGLKLFVLADSRTGYTCGFNICPPQNEEASGNGSSFGAAMNLVKVANLGTGYHIYTDGFFTSPVLFRSLHELRFGACGVMQQNVPGFPRTQENDMPKEAEKGSLRWIREGPSLFVKWMDGKEVAICSTIHKAYSGETVMRRTKNQASTRVKKYVPIPTAVKAYNTYMTMNRVGVSDALIQYCSVSKKPLSWYKQMFFHFVDIAVVNSFLLHKERTLAQQKKALSQRAFLEVLCEQLYYVCCPDGSITTLPFQYEEVEGKENEGSYCCPVTVVDTSLVSNANKATVGRKYCRRCKIFKTIWKCQRCDVPLCLVPDRNCYKVWHDVKKMGKEVLPLQSIQNVPKKFKRTAKMLE